MVMDLQRDAFSFLEYPTQLEWGVCQAEEGVYGIVRQRAKELMWLAAAGLRCCGTVVQKVHFYRRWLVRMCIHACLRASRRINYAGVGYFWCIGLEGCGVGDECVIVERVGEI